MCEATIAFRSGGPQGEADQVEDLSAGTLLTSQMLGSDPEVRSQSGAGPYTPALYTLKGEGQLEAPE